MLEIELPWASSNRSNISVGISSENKVHVGGRGISVGTSGLSFLADKSMRFHHLNLMHYYANLSSVSEEKMVRRMNLRI
jgi:hypothetical protein